MGNLLFLGPTGSGKTRVVEAMAESLFGDAHACIKIDCAEFQHSHEIAKLIGSPPGYLGHRETHPLLTQEALNQWFTEKLKLSILLFDEIEKASDSLWQLLLGILDKATLTLGDNRRVDLSQCIIILTSNLGASEMTDLVDGGLGFAPKVVEVDASFDDKIQRTAVEAARRKFTPEFMNRIDKTVVFKTLRDEHRDGGGVAGAIGERERAAAGCASRHEQAMRQGIVARVDAVERRLHGEGTGRARDVDRHTRPKRDAGVRAVHLDRRCLRARGGGACYEDESEAGGDRAAPNGGHADALAVPHRTFILECQRSPVAR